MKMKKFDQLPHGNGSLQLTLLASFFFFSLWKWEDYKNVSNVVRKHSSF